HAGMGCFFRGQCKHSRGPGLVGTLELVDSLQRRHQLRRDRPADGRRMAAAAIAFRTNPVIMSWIDLPDLLSAPSTDRLVAHGPELDHAAFTAQSLRVAGSLKAASAKRVGLWFRDAAQLGIALLACWRAEAIAVLPGELQPNT